MFGRLVHSRSAEGVSIVEGVFEPRLQIPDHSHTRIGGLFLLGGSLTADARNGPVSLDGPTFSFDPRSQCTNLRVGDRGMRVMLASFEPDLLDSIGVSRSSFGDLRISTQPQVQTAMLQLYAGVHTASDDFAHQAIDFIASVGRGLVAEEQGTPIWLTRAENLLHAGFRDSIGLGTLARTVSIDATHLARTFKKKHGCTVSTYVKRLRVNEAARLMLERGWRAGDAALDCGFADAAHFARCFREVVGVSPRALKDWRRA